MRRRNIPALLVLILLGPARPVLPQAAVAPLKARLNVQLDERGILWRGLERITQAALIDAAKTSANSVVIEVEPNAPDQALEKVLTALREAAITDVSVVAAPSTNPFYLASRDLGYRIVSQEYGRAMGIGRGHHVPPATDWDLFTQLELSLNKKGEITSASRVYGSELPELTDRLVGKSVRGFPGAGRVFARLYLRRLPVR